jgi:undecaprenyl diphosphate synthase
VNWVAQQHADDKAAQQAVRDSGKIPQHVAIIMDGNGRWAEERTLSRTHGHREGINSVRDIVEAASLLGIDHLTLYAFSMENWRRPRVEVTILMDLLLHYLKSELEELNRNNVRLQAIGKLNALPKNVQKQLFECIEAMKDNTGLTLTLALSYSARWDIVRAVQVAALDVRRGKLSPEDITEERFAEYLQTSSQPDPDLLIRTSGELRLSNFLLWEMAYSELYVTGKYWPDFRRKDLYEAVGDYTKRERRFGKTSAQVATQPVPQSTPQGAAQHTSQGNVGDAHAEIPSEARNEAHRAESQGTLKQRILSAFR